MTALQYVQLETQGRVAYVTLNFAEKRNALDYNFVRELKEVLLVLNDDPQIKIIVLKANGPVFCAGLNMEYLKKLQDYSLEENMYDVQHLTELYHLMYQGRRVVVAQVEGDVYGSGMGLLLCSDFVFTTAQIKMGFTEVKYGFVPTPYLPLLLRKLGDNVTRQLLLGGDTIDAKKGQALGFVYEICEQTEIGEKVKVFAERLCVENSGGSMELLKRLMSDLQDMRLADATQFNIKMSAYARKTQEGHAGILAYLDKKPLDWQ